MFHFFYNFFIFVKTVQISHAIFVQKINDPTLLDRIFQFRVLLYGSLYFTGTEASGANIDMLGCSVNYSLDTHYIGFERSVTSSV